MKITDSYLAWMFSGIIYIFIAFFSIFIKPNTPVFIAIFSIFFGNLCFLVLFYMRGRYVEVDRGRVLEVGKTIKVKRE